MIERITIKDIAKALNIHHSTVSRALRNDDKVKDETRILVQNYANKHGYQINMLAKELRGDKRKIIAVIVPNINHNFFSNVISQITNYALKKGYVISVFQTNESYKQEIQIIDKIIQNNFAGVIASISMESFDTFHFNKLMKFNIPLVMFDRVSDDINVPKVRINNVEIMQEIMTLLVNKKYKRIVHISGPSGISVFDKRQRGYNLSVKRLGLNYQKIIKLDNAFSKETGKIVANDLFNEDIYPDAVISDSSNLTYGLIMQLRKMRLKIPNDIALITFGDNPILELLEPSITSIIQPCEAIAQSSFDLLMNRINSINNNIIESIILSAKICLRNSI